jgi:histidine triad (HIT) family protein
VFCQIVAGEAPATIHAAWDDAIAIVPLNPVTEGHLLVLPRQHVMDALEDPQVTAAVMARAAEWAPWPCNIITSAGPAATQTVFHLHVHIVPRSEGDGLALPWTAQSDESMSHPEPTP